MRNAAHNCGSDHRVAQSAGQHGACVLVPDAHIACVLTQPTYAPTRATGLPTSAPTNVPVSVPTKVPTSDPTGAPTYLPTTSTPTSAPTPLPVSNMLGAWPFRSDLNANPTGNAFVMNAAGGPTFANVTDSLGQTRSCLKFSVSDNQHYVYENSGAGINGLRTGTMSIWALWSSTAQPYNPAQGNYGTIMSRQADGRWSDAVMGLSAANPNASSTVLSYFHSGGSGGCPGRMLGVTNVGLNKWHHIAVTWDGSRVILYMDGNVERSKTSTCGMDTWSSSGYRPFQVVGRARVCVCVCVSLPARCAHVWRKLKRVDLVSTVCVCACVCACVCRVFNTAHLGTAKRFWEVCRTCRSGTYR